MAPTVELTAERAGIRLCCGLLRVTGSTGFADEGGGCLGDWTGGFVDG